MFSALPRSSSSFIIFVMVFVLIITLSRTVLFLRPPLMMACVAACWSAMYREPLLDGCKWLLLLRRRRPL